MLRRILSPRQPQQAQESRSTTRAGQFVDSKPRSLSSSAIQSNGQLGRSGDEGEEVKNSSYGDPDNFHRTQSMITTPTREMNPPLPPRNTRPLSGFKQNETESESSVYVTPADTLRNRPPSQRPPAPGIAAGNTNSQGPTAGSVEPTEAMPTRSERRVMQMHQLTMNQRRGQGGGAPVTAVKPTNGHNRTKSFGTVTENSDYSVPFDLKGNPRPARARRNEDCIIPINPPSSTSPQPPSDRSDTNSPSSPMSNQSVEQEPPRMDDGNSDYAVPWDRNRIFQNIPRGVRRPTHGKSFRNDEAAEEFGSSHRLQDDQEVVQPPQIPARNEEQKPAGGVVREYSPPAPARSGFRYQSAREPIMVAPQGPDVSPPPPDLPFDPYRPHRNRAVSDRVHHRRDGSTSPVNGPGSRGEDTRYHSQSMSFAASRNSPHPPARLDPPMERGRGDSYPLPPLRDQSVREDVGRQNQVVIDVSIPLKDQPWYHGNVTRAEAEDILRDRPDFSFLVRKSESCQTDYSLSIRDTSPNSAAGYYHLRLVYEKDPPGYVLGQFSNTFEKVTECIAFYTKQRLNIRGAEHKRLRFPIPRGPPTDRGQGYLTTIGV